MNEYWKERIQFIRDLEYLRTVFEDQIGCDEEAARTITVQSIVEDQLSEYLQKTLDANPKKKEKK